jgi:hypothetical protein
MQVQDLIWSELDRLQVTYALEPNYTPPTPTTQWRCQQQHLCGGGGAANAFLLQTLFSLHLQPRGAPVGLHGAGGGRGALAPPAPPVASPLPPHTHQQLMTSVFLHSTCRNQISILRFQLSNHLICSFENFWRRLDRSHISPSTWGTTSTDSTFSKKVEKLQITL